MDEDLRSINKWAANNRMALNAEKTKSIWYAASLNIDRLPRTKGF